MTLGELADLICTKIGQTDEESLAACRKFLNARWLQVWDAAPWRESLGVASATCLAAAEGVLIVPDAVERVMAVRQGIDGLTPVEANVLAQYDPGLWDEAGAPHSFATLTPTALPAIGAGQKVSVSSDFFFPTAEAVEPDAAAEIYIAGEDHQGYFAEETISLSLRLIDDVSAYFVRGESRYLYRNVTAISKPETVNPLYVGYAFGEEEMGAEGQAKLRARVTAAPKLQRIQLLPRPTSDTAVQLLGKRRFRPLLEDGAQPELRNTDNVLLALATGDMLERQRQYSKAQAKFEEGAAQLQILLDLERNQSATNIRIIPADIHGMGEGDFHFGASGKGYW